MAAAAARYDGGGDGDNWNSEGTLHELNQMVNLMANHLVKLRCVARDANPRLKLT